MISERGRALRYWTAIFSCSKRPLREKNELWHTISFFPMPCRYGHQQQGIQQFETEWGKNICGVSIGYLSGGGGVDVPWG
jgi:hypothetical protein